jgi:dTDP-L-rhamnose 4-epimerase
MRILISGGAGFIGSHLANRLGGLGHEIRILDALVPQVHGPQPSWPQQLLAGSECMYADVADREAWVRALDDIDIVYHLAAEVGVGQSMYEIVRYVRANTLGTAIFVELLASGKFPIQKVIVASSMSIYGEGAYVCPNCGPQSPYLRSTAKLESRNWELDCPQCGDQLSPIATHETKPLQPTSIYAITKRDQEEMCLSVGMAYEIPTVALRFFNVYGPGQALSNPYTGIAAIFSSRLLNGNRPFIFEDGRQSRDFINVNDLVDGLILAMTSEEAEYQALNLGTGIPHTVLDVANTLAEKLGLDIAPEVVSRFRAGDIRHCFADIGRARELLGFQPKIRFEDGIAELARWVHQQEATDSVAEAQRALDLRGLTR